MKPDLTCFWLVRIRSKKLQRLHRILHGFARLKPDLTWFRLVRIRSRNCKGCTEPYIGALRQKLCYICEGRLTTLIVEQLRHFSPLSALPPLAIYFQVATTNKPRSFLLQKYCAVRRVGPRPHRNQELRFQRHPVSAAKWKTQRDTYRPMNKEWPTRQYLTNICRLCSRSRMPFVERSPIRKIFSFNSFRQLIYRCANVQLQQWAEHSRLQAEQLQAFQNREVEPNS